MDMEPIPRAVDVTRPAATASGLAHMEAGRLGHQYLGPEHLLVGLLAEGDNLAAQGVLPGPQPADEELLASLDPPPLVCARAIRLRLSRLWSATTVW
jgi:hypothetical protein